jgi:acetyl esterase/lipase
VELDDAFANAAYIPNGETFVEKWAALSADFRETALCELDIPYGEGARARFDLFHPARLARGVVVFVHGGYWRMFDKSYWSHLAAGPLAHGWAVAMPSYDLCPHASVTEIGDQIAAAIAAIADRVPGPIRMTGHSAGGQLVARVGAIGPHGDWKTRLQKIVPISAVADLTPLLRTSMNADLQLDGAEARGQSPVHLTPPNCPVTVWVGADERPVFIEQSQELAKSWDCELMIETAKHHFDVIETLVDPNSPLTHAVCADTTGNTTEG